MIVEVPDINVEVSEVNRDLDESSVAWAVQSRTLEGDSVSRSWETLS